MPIFDVMVSVGLGPTKPSMRMVITDIAIDLHESLLRIRAIIVKIYSLL